MLAPTVLCAALFLVAYPPPVPETQSYAKLAPYSGVRWQADAPEVLVEGTWYGLRAIDAVGVDALVAFSRETFGSKWQKRIGEDLVELLSKMGHPPGDAVDLALTDLATGDVRVMKDVAMTREKRTAVRMGPPNRVSRAHAKEADPAFAHLTEPVATKDSPTTVWLSRKAAEEDLDELEWTLAQRYSYWKLAGVDGPAAFDAVRLGLGERIERASFAIQVMKLLALFGDGHTRVEESESSLLPRGYTPALVEIVGERLVALQPDRSGFLDAKRPYLVALDGVPIERWLEAAARTEANGAPHSVRRSAARKLRFLQYLRRELGLEETARVELTLASENGGEKKRLRVTDDRPLYGRWPRGRSHERLAGDFGYLRLEQMNADAPFLISIATAMQDFRDTRGLIIDVRGNGGGSRDALRTLFPYFMRPDDAPHVANVAAYRIGPGEDPHAREGHLANRALFPAASSRWKRAESAAIEALAKGFTPRWRPPESEFSDWHYMVLAPTEEGGVYPYTQPVVVLMNGDCFSATDIFLGAFAGWRNVTLMGEPSAGGSGRSRELALRNSGLVVRVSSMASFRRDGALYDGRGVAPDVLVSPAPTDFLGTTDTVLDAALALLSE